MPFWLIHTTHSRWSIHFFVVFFCRPQRMTISLFAVFLSADSFIFLSFFIVCLSARNEFYFRWIRFDPRHASAQIEKKKGNVHQFGLGWKRNVTIFGRLFCPQSIRRIMQHDNHNVWKERYDTIMHCNRTHHTHTKKKKNNQQFINFISLHFHWISNGAERPMNAIDKKKMQEKKMSVTETYTHTATQIYSLTPEHSSFMHVKYNWIQTFHPVETVSLTSDGRRLTRTFVR